MAHGSTSERPAPAPRVTQADVARRAGVSTSIVSRELSGDPALRARPETRRKIVAGLRMLDSKREELPTRKHGNVPL